MYSQIGNHMYEDVEKWAIITRKILPKYGYKLELK
jgi:hypothetical protein